MKAGGRILIFDIHVGNVTLKFQNSYRRPTERLGDFTSIVNGWVNSFSNLG